MSISLNDKSTSTTKLLAGVSPVDAILNGTSKNAIQNKAVYNALKDKIEKSVNDLIYYYDTSQVYNKAEVRELIGQINTLTIEVVSTLPTQDISTTTIYFVGPAAGTNTYDEYIYTNNAWAKIGDTSIDLTQYVTSSYLTTLLQSYYTKAEVNNLLNSYYTKTEVDNLLANVEIDVDDTLSGSSKNPVQNKVIKAKIDDIEDEIDTKQDKEFVGTTAQWNALTTEQKNQYVLVNLTDDKEALGVDAVDAVTNGDMRPVTSNAVYDNFYNTLGAMKVVQGTLSAQSSATVTFESSTRGLIAIIGAGSPVPSLFIMNTDGTGGTTFAPVLTGSGITYNVNAKYSVVLNNAYTSNPIIYVLLFTGNCTVV